MKTKAVLLVGIVLLAGCASTGIQDRQLNREEMDATEILGSVQTSFNLMGIIVGLVAVPPSEENIKEQAYAKLLEEANRSYAGNIDIRNVNISPNGRKLTFFGYEYIYNATGSVISTYTNSQRTANRLGGITSQILDTFRGNRKEITLAIFDFINVNGKQSVLGRYLSEQTSNYLFQNSELHIVERTQIERVMQEQNFGMSGYVSDETAVRIGNLLGANAVTLGTLTKVGNKISVNIKIVETESASVLSSGSTEIEGEEYIEMYNEML